MYIWHPLSPRELIWFLTGATWIDALSSYDVSSLFLFLSPSHEMTIVVVVTLTLMADGVVTWRVVMVMLMMRSAMVARMMIVMIVVIMIMVMMALRRAM